MIRKKAALWADAIADDGWRLAQRLQELVIWLAVILCSQTLIIRAAQSAEILTLSPNAGPSLVIVKGELDLSDAFKFAEKTTDLKEAIVLLESPGGRVFAGISIGRAIRRKGFLTAVPSSVKCASACALAWLGGAQRLMAEDSYIGFHAPVVVKHGKPRTSQAAKALVAGYLNELALPERAIDYITRAPPGRLNWLTPDKAGDLGIEVGSYGPDAITGSVAGAEVTGASTIKRVRFVDLYGFNFPGMPIRNISATDCETRCRNDGDCAAFTFNEAHSACFLKARVELAISHPAAVSGYRERWEKRIRRVNMSIQESTDYPGNDIDRLKRTTFEACVLACSETKACKAFTYIIRRRECWLKNGAGSPEPQDGLVSGIK